MIFLTELFAAFLSAMMVENLLFARAIGADHILRQTRSYRFIIEFGLGAAVISGVTVMPLWWLSQTFGRESWWNYARSMAAVLLIDNYDDLMKNLSDNERSAILSEIDNRLDAWVAGTGSLLRRYQRERYLMIFEERYLQQFVEKKFEVLDAIHQVSNPSGINASLSIGIGKDGESFQELLQFANLSIEMALSRGGDQAVIRNKFTFEFYGGRSAETEKRTKVKSRVMANALSALLADSSQIFVMGHKFPDMDATGAAVGVCAAARKKGVPAYIIKEATSNPSKPLIDKLLQQPEYHTSFLMPQEALLIADSRSLVVVVDTNRPEQVQSQEMLASCNRVAVIDHHRRAATYIEGAALNYHEPYASSASELVTELLQYIVEPADLLRVEAEALLAENIGKLSSLQDKLYAQDRYAVLVIFQAMDAAGKDGTIKHVMSGINPQGCQVYSFKQPSAEELDHDYLWRINRCLPERGRIGIFNRSHYEDVLVAKVHPEIVLSAKLPGIMGPGDITPKFWKKRYRQINDYERYLTENGTVIIKFFLNVSKEEQKRRFLSRLEDEAKNWKFSVSDLKERSYWDDYMKAYSDMLTHTSTEEAPWYVIPADNKWFMRYAVGQILCDRMNELDLHYPEMPVEARHQIEDFKRALLNE